MAWFECHQTLARHPKTLKLAMLLGCDRRYAVGLLVDLFSWGLDAAGIYGALPDVSADAIAMALDLTGKKGSAAVDALVQAGYLERNSDGGYAIHDWNDYAGKLVAARIKDKERKRNSGGNP